MRNEAILTGEKLAEQMKLVLSNTEELMNATAGQAGEKIQSVRARIEETLRSAKASIEELEHAAVEKAKYAARATDGYVHENPWQSIGVAAGVGLVIGWLIGRK